MSQAEIRIKKIKFKTQKIEIDTQMIQILALSGVNFKLTLIKMFKILDDKMGLSREVETIKKNKIKTVEMNTTVTETEQNDLTSHQPQVERELVNWKVGQEKISR